VKAAFLGPKFASTSRDMTPPSVDRAAADYAARLARLSKVALSMTADVPVAEETGVPMVGYDMMTPTLAGTFTWYTERHDPMVWPRRWPNVWGIPR
jgi:hypothetical protein